MASQQRLRSPWWADTFAPLIEVGKWVWAFVPKRLRPGRPHFNYITVHYCFIIGTTIAMSIMIVAYGNMAYIDALFFAAGTATQSGLNTIDVNNLKTYQQVIFALGSCICTPIWINTAVVFVRLYWFEKRFEHIVKESRMQRRTETLSRSKSQMRADLDDPGALEMGVRGRAISLIPGTLKSNGKAKATDDTAPVTDGSFSSASSSRQLSSEETMTAEDQVKPLTVQTDLDHFETPPESAQQSPDTELQPRRTEITFADQVSTSGNDSPKLARIHNPSPDDDINAHVKFLERQNADKTEGGALYIPGPRDFEKGQTVKQLDRDDVLRRQVTRNSVVSQDESTHSGEDATAEHNGDESPVAGRLRRDITFNEPQRPEHRGRNVDNADGFTRRGRSRSGRRFSFSGNTLSETGRAFTRTLTNITRPRSSERDPIEAMPYFTWEATTGRNSTFLGLTQEQREELGGLEYRSLKTLAGILLCYFFGFHLFGWIVFAPWIVRTEPYRGLVAAQGQNPIWWGLFTPISMFNDLGLTLTNNSMIPFNDAVVPLLIGSFLVVIGNTGFPVMLRFIIWTMSKITTRESPLWKELQFLLEHPRRCFTLLFPSKATWWLFWVLVLLNGIDLLFFVILDFGVQEVETLSPGFRVLNGWFMAVSTRTAGFSSVNLANLHAAIQVSYLIMMYISIFPIAISVRRTNVYEEKSLGIFGGEEDPGDGEPSYVSQHLRRQLSFDLWYIFLGLFIIAIVEGDRIANTNQYAFTTFSVLFEIVSAYGTVGLSLGYPTINASFSAEFRTLSKLVIIAMMIRGRHRGLPYALDRSILLPSDKLNQKEEEDAKRTEARLRRRGSLFAEGADTFNHSKTWEDGELDNSGLPRQHTIARHPTIATSIAPSSAGAGAMARRTTNMSTQSEGGTKHGRSRSLGRLAASALSAGPTFQKHH